MMDMSHNRLPGSQRDGLFLTTPLANGGRGFLGLFNPGTRVFVPQQSDLPTNAQCSGL